MKKRMVKICSMIMALSLVVTAAGCGSSENKKNKNIAGGASESTDISGELVIWYNDYPFEPSLQAVIEGFNKQYPNVEVDYEIKADGDYYSLLQTAIQSGSGPDLFWTNGTATSTMPDFAANGAVENLKDVVDFSFLSESAMELSEVDGGYYSVPWMTLDTRTCFYNKDMFKEHGWEIPTTFSEFEKLLSDIHKEGITPISMAYEPWSMLFVYEPLLSAYSPEYSKKLTDYSVKADDKTAREAYQLMVDWAKKGYFGDNWLGVVDNAAQILTFTTGKAAIDIAGSWDAVTIQENNPDLNLGAFTIPSEDGTTGLVGTNSNGLSVNAESNNLDAANAFANYCATKEAQTVWVQTQGAVSGTDEIEASSEIAREISEGGQGNTYRSWQNVLSSYSSTGNASTIWQSDFPKAFTGEMKVDEVMDGIAAEMK